MLPQSRMQIIRDIAALANQNVSLWNGGGRFSRRLSPGLGISVLFTGENGSGKAMAAEAIAGELNLDLFRIDLSQVVGRSIAETERNLRGISHAAGCGGAVLFFDEADVLFGERSQDKASQGRYAGIALEYLLGRTEKYPGLAIFSRAAQGEPDPALVRSFRFIVEFP